MRAQRIRSLFQELKRRRVFRAAGVYVVGAFAALQGASVLVPALHMQEWVMTLLVVLVLVFFPIAMGLAWVFDIVPERGGLHLRREPADGPLKLQEPAERRLPIRSATPCVAVVPFLNLSGDAENEMFADGITEDIIAHLSKVRALKVIARASVMPFKKREPAQPVPYLATAARAASLTSGWLVRPR